MAQISFPFSTTSRSQSQSQFLSALDSFSDPEFDSRLFDTAMNPNFEFPPPHHQIQHDDDDDDDDQVRFISNLFQRSSRNTHTPLPDSPLQEIHDPTDIDLELGLGLGLGLCTSTNVAASSSKSKSSDATCRFEGLRVVAIDSESDSDINEVRDGFGGVTDFDRPPFCWDYLGFNNRRNNDEQMDDDSSLGVQDQRGLELPDVAAVNDDERSGDFYFDRCFEGYDGDVNESPDHLNLDDIEREAREVTNLFDSYQERAEQEIMIQSGTDEGGDLDVEVAIRDLEWEILLAVNNFNREVYEMDVNVDMYDAILGEVEGHLNDWTGSPPAAQVVIENLPIVRLSGKSLEEDAIVCAICKDSILEEEEVRKLPCSHYYHGDCILPWLKLRNTCPVCRHELPTDDSDYEYQKRSMDGWNSYNNGSPNSFDLNH